MEKMKEQWYLYIHALLGICVIGGQRSVRIAPPGEVREISCSGTCVGGTTTRSTSCWWRRLCNLQVTPSEEHFSQDKLRRDGKFLVAGPLWRGGRERGVILNNFWPPMNVS